MDEIFVEQIVKRKTGISVVLMRVFSIIVLIMVFLLMISEINAITSGQNPHREIPRVLLFRRINTP